jgi:hypothetical protein
MTALAVVVFFLGAADSRMLAAVYYFETADCLSTPLAVSMRYDLPTVKFTSNYSEICAENLSCLDNPHDESCRDPRPVFFSDLFNDTAASTFINVVNASTTVKSFHVCYPSRSFRNCYAVHVPLAALMAPEIALPSTPSQNIVTASLIVAGIGLLVTAALIFAVWRTRQQLAYEVTLPEQPPPVDREAAE